MGQETRKSCLQRAAGKAAGEGSGGRTAASATGTGEKSGSICAYVHYTCHLSEYSEALKIFINITTFIPSLNKYNAMSTIRQTPC